MALIKHWFNPTILTLNASLLEGGPADVYLADASCTLNWINGITTDPELADPGSWDDNGTPGDLADDPWSPGDYHLTTASPCIDTGDDGALHLPALDMDGDLRMIDGNGDGTPRVDIGADEYMQTAPCEGDLDHDGDVDGSDLAEFADAFSAGEAAAFALAFGRTDCPY